MAAPAPSFPRLRFLVSLAVGGLGLSAVMTQLALMRELLAAFSGNELVLGICLGSWLLLTGAGTWVGRLFGPFGEPGSAASRPRATTGVVPRAARWFIAGQIAIAVIPLAQVVAVRVLRDIVFSRGAAIGVAGTLGGSLVLLAPFCLVSGALLTLGSQWLARRPAPPAPAATVPPGGATTGGGIRRVYLADTVGGVAGGVLFSLVLVPRLDHFALLCVPAFVNLALAALLAVRCRAWLLLESTAVIAGGLAVHLALVNADRVTTALQHRGEEVVFRANSPYGRLVVGDRDGLLTFYENGLPVAATENTLQVEEAVLYALSQRPAPRAVLLIGGGAAGDAREIRRASPATAVTDVELDPAIIAAGLRLLPRNLDDPLIRVVNTDGRRFVREIRQRFDAVIVDLPDPSTSQLNRFYTEEFFREVRRILAPGGVFAFGLGHYDNYVSAALARLLASAHRTLAGVFPDVAMIPGGRVFFLASDQPIRLDLAALFAERGLRPRLLTRHYLDATMAPDRLADLDRAIAQPAAPNTDFSPALYSYYLRRWLSQFGRRPGWPVGILFALLAVYLVRLRPVPRVLFAAGFAASALEVVLLLGFQIVYGSVYRQVGLVVTVFMAGLGAGAWWAGRRRADGAAPRPALRPLAWLALGVAATAAALPWWLLLPERLDAWTGGPAAGQGLILLATLVLALTVGAQFALAGSAETGTPTAVAARLFSADLAGAALGALLVSALLIPWLGVTAVCLATAGLNAGAGILAWRTAAA